MPGLVSSPKMDGVSVNNMDIEELPPTLTAVTGLANFYSQWGGVAWTTCPGGIEYTSL